MNWYNKISQVLNTNYPEKNDPEIVRGPKQAICPYHKGMRVRDRRKGMANPQEFGVVDSIKNNIMIIVWNPNKKNEKKEKFNINEDSEKLALIVAEV